MGPGSPEKGGRPQYPAGKSFAGFTAFLTARPFCFWFGSRDPHVPWDRGRQRKVSLNPARVRIPAHLPDHPAVRQDMLNYYCEVQQFDSDCGEILATLPARERDNTLVIMISDNGWQIPRGLANCYDPAVRIPLVMQWPGRTRSGGVREDYVIGRSCAVHSRGRRCRAASGYDCVEPVFLCPLLLVRGSVRRRGRLTVQTDADERQTISVLRSVLR
jgi:hypothetical protein